MIELTDWAREIVTKSQAAAARFNPSARIRLARVGGEVRELSKLWIDMGLSVVSRIDAGS